jgi:hypothetical protein
MKKVILKMDFGTANAVREAVYQAQQGYSKEYPPIRIVNLREVMQILDDQIEDIDVID